MENMYGSSSSEGDEEEGRGGGGGGGGGGRGSPERGVSVSRGDRSGPDESGSGRYGRREHRSWRDGSRRARGAPTGGGVGLADTGRRGSTRQRSTK